MHITFFGSLQRDGLVAFVFRGVVFHKLPGHHPTWRRRSRLGAFNCCDYGGFRVSTLFVCALLLINYVEVSQHTLGTQRLEVFAKARFVGSSVR